MLTPPASAPTRQFLCSGSKRLAASSTAQQAAVNRAVTIIDTFERYIVCIPRGNEPVSAKHTRKHQQYFYGLYCCTAVLGKREDKSYGNIYYTAVRDAIFNQPRPSKDRINQPCRDRYQIKSPPCAHYYTIAYHLRPVIEYKLTSNDPTPNEY